MNRWPYIKAVFAHLTDWSFQTSRQAMYKQTDRLASAKLLEVRR